MSRRISTPRIRFVGAIAIAPGDVERFLAKTHPEPTTGCWLWLGALDKKGYARFPARMRDGKRRSLEAHRFSAAALGHHRVDDLDIDHRCSTRCCVNPDHLEPTTHHENNRRSTSPTAINARKTHCPHGHKLVQGKGRRRCSTCGTIQQRERRKRACPPHNPSTS